MSSLSHRPRRRFAQHFLTQSAIAERIVAEADLTGAEAVVEIGPGRGALTGLLLERAARLSVVEVDRDLAAELRRRFADRIEMIEGDILKIDLGPFADADSVVVANLPYNISTPVMMKLIEQSPPFGRLVLMLQLEVAERLIAAPGTRSYGALGVMAQILSDVRLAFRVSPGAFFPRPRVESAVVVIEPRIPPPLNPGERARARRLVRTLFAARRKQLHNTLAPLLSQPRTALEAEGIDPRRRPDTLSIEEILRLARHVEGCD